MTEFKTFADLDAAGATYALIQAGAGDEHWIINFKSRADGYIPGWIIDGSYACPTGDIDDDMELPGTVVWHNGTQETSAPTLTGEVVTAAAQAIVNECDEELARALMRVKALIRDGRMMEVAKQAHRHDLRALGVEVSEG